MAALICCSESDAFAPEPVVALPAVPDFVAPDVEENIPEGLNNDENEEVVELPPPPRAALPDAAPAAAGSLDDNASLADAVEGLVVVATVAPSTP